MKKLLKNTLLGGAATTTFATLSLGGMAAQSAWRTYHANDPVGRNLVAIVSAAPLETMLTRTSAVTGTVEVDPKNPAKAPRAKFIVDATTLDTGIAMRNQQMKSDKWLDTAKYPKISFTLTKFQAMALPLGSSKMQNVTGLAEGKLYFHGRTRMVATRLDITAMQQDAKTKERLPGDLLHVHANFFISLKDFGVDVPKMAQLKVADKQQIVVDIFSSTGSPSPDAKPASQS